MSFIEVRARSRRALAPPPRLKLSEWIEANIVLPDTTATPGRMRLWPYQREIADAISDPEIERVSLVKATRIGFTALLTATVGAYAVNEPSPILVLLPTEADARDYTVSDIEPTFAATPVLRNVLSAETGDEDRNTLLHRRFPGGSLKIVASKAPRNLRRHTARVLMIDEADAMEVSAEGSPIVLAERRTMTFGNRKIILGSTPIDAETSAVLSAYHESDQRIFEVPCSECGAFTEILWQHIEWEPDRPETAAFRCPHCHALVTERYKARMVGGGQWRATNPDVKGHAGFRLNALVSLLANASWARLAKEFLAAKNHPDLLQPFVNTVLAEGWRGGAAVDETTLAARAEPFSLNAIPKEVLAVTVGTDVQDDRLETAVLGWTRSSEALVLGYFVIWGSFDDDGTWSELDELLRSKWKHPFHAQLKVDAAIVDAGDGDHFNRVLSFCAPRMNRRIFAGKGVFGNRPGFAMAKGKAIGDKLAIIGVDPLKTLIFDRLSRGQGLRFSETLEPSFYEQLASQRRVIRYKRGMPSRRFEMISPRARCEALDAVTYAFAARAAVNIVYDRREAELRGQAPQRPTGWRRLAT
jgi:phage terminase large subunit GpA-like protein